MESRHTAVVSVKSQAEVFFATARDPLRGVLNFESTSGAKAGKRTRNSNREFENRTWNSNLEFELGIESSQAVSALRRGIEAEQGFAFLHQI